MSDFDVTSFVSTPRSDVLKILVLQRRNYLIDRFDDCFADYSRSFVSTQRVSVLKGAFIGLIMECYVMIDNYLVGLNGKIEKEKFKCANDLINAVKDVSVKKLGSVNDLKEVLFEIEKILYAKGVTRFDTKKAINYQDIEEVNETEGYN